jgi:hypothetical protein
LVGKRVIHVVLASKESSAARHESGSIVLTANRLFREWSVLCDVDKTLVAEALWNRALRS